MLYVLIGAYATYMSNYIEVDVITMSFKPCPSVKLFSFPKLNNFSNSYTV